MADRGEYRGIYAAVLDDPDFQGLSSAARLAWFVLKIQLGSSGIGVAYDAVIGEQTGLSHEALGAALAQLEAGEWLIRERNVFWLRNGLRYDPTLSLSNPNHRTSIEKYLRSLPRLTIVSRFAVYYGMTSPFESHPETAPIPSPIPSPSHADPIGIPGGITETDTDTESTTAAAAAVEGDPDFESAWSAYPARAGDNPKSRALKAWRARRRSGVPAADLAAGVQRYARYVRAAGKEGTEYVMQAATFFGPDRRWGEPYTLNGNGASGAVPPSRIIVDD